MNTDTNFQGLRRYNLLAGVLHTVSVIAIVALANGFGLPVTANYMAGPPGSSKHQLVVFGHVSMALLIATFFASQLSPTSPSPGHGGRATSRASQDNRTLIGGSSTH
jgi:hypothetical protein